MKLRFCIVMVSFVILILVSSCSIDDMIEQEQKEILASVEKSEIRVISEEDIVGLPIAVQNWLKQSGVIGKQEIKSGLIKQRAEMKLKPEQKEWYFAEAEQYFTTFPPAFIWTVDMKIPPFLKIKGRDKFVDGRGEMLIRMNSLINIVKEKGEKLDEGTIQRYLGEIVWYPSAALNPYIEWEEIDELSAQATMTYQGTSGSGIFYFNEQGDFERYSALRFMGNEPDAEKYEWVVTAEAYKSFNGVRVPVQMKALWMLPDGEWNWLKLQIDEINYN